MNPKGLFEAEGAIIMLWERTISGSRLIRKWLAAGTIAVGMALTVGAPTANAFTLSIPQGGDGPYNYTIAYEYWTNIQCSEPIVISGYDGRTCFQYFMRRGLPITQVIYYEYWDGAQYQPWYSDRIDY